MAEAPKLKIFISWSGRPSRALADIVHDWLPAVLPFADPWMSAKDISKGQRWDAEIGDSLEKSSYCVVCVTPNVAQQPWVNFEAGAVSKIVEKSYVSPLLLSVSIPDLSGLPLSRFQCTLFEKDEIRGLLESINRAAGSPVSRDRLNNSLDFSWAGFRAKVDGIDLSDDELSGDVSDERDEPGSERQGPEAEAILVLVAGCDNDRPTVAQIAGGLNEDRVQTQYHIDRLVIQDLLNESEFLDEPSDYWITRKGRAYVVENELL